jgi:hypothetical protein
MQLSTEVGYNAIVTPKKAEKRLNLKTGAFESYSNF